MIFYAPPDPKLTHLIMFWSWNDIVTMIFYASPDPKLTHLIIVLELE